MAAALTTTSYAILGLLAIKPWTTYELTQQMHRALGQFWPRAESKLYEEPKKLVAHGLAPARREHVASARAPSTRSRRRAGGRLAAWVPTPAPGPAVLEFEPTGQGVLRRARHERRPARDDRGRARVDRRAARGPAESRRVPRRRGAFPERLPWLSSPGSCSTSRARRTPWAEWAAALVETWPDDVSRAEPTLDTARDMAQRLERELAGSEVD